AAPAFGDRLPGTEPVGKAVQSCIAWCTSNRGKVNDRRNNIPPPTGKIWHFVWLNIHIVIPFVYGDGTF
ncbi:MAG: hypothetical protein ACYDBA_14390, partial [Sulfuricaulis sp.]